jgi:hypothetical protein
MVDTGSCTWVRMPDAQHVSLQIQNGDPLILLRAFANDFHVNVEPLRDADSACWTAVNDVGSSNHLSGTGMDLNWNGADGRTFRLGITGERAYPDGKLQRLRDLLMFYEDIIFCGGFWSIRDWMHFQLNGRTFNNPRTGDFIKRKIRADGRSTYQRGGTPSPPPPPPAMSKQDRYALAVIEEGRRRGITPRGIQIALSVPFVESGWKMYANSTVPASLNLPHDAVGSDHDSVGLFQQRHPMWGPLEVLMDPAKSAGLFYDRLARMDYNNPNRLPGDFAADVQRPAAQYRGRYQERMGDAVALYNRLANVQSPEGDDELSNPDVVRKIDAIYLELTKRYPSRSRLRWLDERDGPVDTLAGMVLNDDGNDHVLFVKELAKLGHPESLSLLHHIAGGDPAKYPHRANDIQLAQAILADIDSSKAVPQARSTETITIVDDAKLREENRRLHHEIVELRNAPKPEPEIVYLPAPAQELEQEPEPAPRAVKRAPAVIDPNASTGQIIGQAYDALQALRLADALPIEDRAPLAALIAVLQTKNGADLGGQK